MKKIIFFIILAIIIQTKASSQSCLPDGITFSTQASIDNFQTNYPNCNEIEGNVVITGNGITNLNGLNVLTNIGGYLNIYNTYNLTSFIGLENLESIGNDFEIDANHALINLAGLTNLSNINGRLRISNNSDLVSLTGLNSLISTSQLSINGNPSLTLCENVCNYLSNPSGSVNIFSNAPGCNNPHEITDSCGFTLPCLPFGNYYLYTQTDIDNFQINYMDCSNLEGSVMIYGLYNIINLNGLSIINSIAENLTLMENKSLTSLSGLENLNTIGGVLNIHRNKSLTNLNEFNSLNAVGSMIIYQNESLNSISGLENLSAIGGSLRIEDNIALTSCSGLESLTSIEGELNIGYNDILSDLSGLDSVNTIGGRLIVYNNSDLVSLEGLNNLTSINGDLSLWRNHNLISLNGLINVLSIDGVLDLRNNNALTSLSGLDSINGNTITGLNIDDNYFLSICDVQSVCDYLFLSLPWNGGIHGNAPGCNSTEEVRKICEFPYLCLSEGITFTTQSQIDSFQINYPECTIIEGDVIIRGSDINNLVGLNSLTSIEGHFEITHNPLLASLVGLDNITNVNKNLNINHNDKLVNLTGLDSLSYVGAFLNISYNNTLTSLTGINQLLNIEGPLWVANNSLLNDLNGLDNVRSVGGDLRIFDNNSLINILGLSSLTSIEGRLEVSNNQALTNLAGLGNINSGSIEKLVVTDNSSLSTCGVLSICNYLINPGGFIYISNNAYGCNNQSEVEAACANWVSDVSGQLGIIIYPNPSKSTISIYTKNGTVINEIIIYNQLGKMVLYEADINHDIDISKLCNGIYIIELVLENQSIRKKLIIEK